MTTTHRRTIAATAATLAIAPIIAVTAYANPAHAETCYGTNSEDKFYSDPRGNGQGYNIKMDSCRIQESMRERQDDVNAISAASAVGGFFNKLLTLPGVVTNVQQQHNKQVLQDCASAGTGVSYREVNGVVTNCARQ